MDDHDSACANPILLGFLKDYHDKAKEINSKGATTYKRAYESMKACPITFQHPSEAVVLNGLGPKLIEKMTADLEKYCRANGLPMPSVPKRGNARRKHDLLEAANEAVDITHPPNPAAKKRKTRPYLPTYRSGAYALLTALYSEDRELNLTKQQLIPLAQPHCDSSFDAPSEPGKFYTAWASMKTLLDKDLVYGRGNPKRYCLTETGVEVAQGLVEVGRRSASVGILRESTGNVGRSETAAKSSADPSSRGGRQKENKPTTRKKAPKRGAMPADDDSDLEGIATKMDAAAALTNEKTMALRRRLQALFSDAPQEYGVRHSTDKNKSKDKDKDKPRVPSSEEPGRAKSTSVVEPFIYVDLTTPSPPRDAGHILSRNTSLPLESALPAVSHSPPPRTKTSAPTTSFPPISSATSTSQQLAQLSPPVFPPFTPEVLKAGTFTIHFILDNREVRSKNDREYLQRNLFDVGIEALTRPLQVGDALWIAKEKGGLGREIVLDYIVERKRLDDLVGSIKDGRFHEQKFRLKKSGVKKVIYIIEDITLRDVDASMQDAMDTAVSSTMVVSGFFVKRTAKLDDTIKYLASLTRLLESTYQNQDLYLAPDDLIESRTYQAFMSHLSNTYPGKSFYLLYETFSSLVSKSASLTLRDIFLKMLMCVRGVSAEKALEIQKVFGTPRGLVEAFEKCNSEGEMKDMIMKMCEGAVARKKIGKALSAKIAEVWAGVGAEED